ncbi:MAG: serine hydrolase [Erysipelotrichaceae bacterium]
MGPAREVESEELLQYAPTLALLPVEQFKLQVRVNATLGYGILEEDSGTHVAKWDLATNEVSLLDQNSQAQLSQEVLAASETYVVFSEYDDDLQTHKVVAYQSETQTSKVLLQMENQDEPVVLRASVHGNEVMIEGALNTKKEAQLLHYDLEANQANWIDKRDTSLPVYFQEHWYYIAYENNASKLIEYNVQNNAKGVVVENSGREGTWNEVISDGTQLLVALQKDDTTQLYALNREALKLEYMWEGPQMSDFQLAHDYLAFTSANNQQVLYDLLNDQYYLLGNIPFWLDATGVLFEQAGSNGEKGVVNAQSVLRYKPFVERNASTKDAITPFELQVAIDRLVATAFSASEQPRLSIGLVRPSDGVQYMWNETTMYKTASTIKVPINLYVYELAQQDPSLLQKRLTYQSYHYEGGTGILQYQAVGNTYTVQELLTYSIVYSDNVATNMLILHFFESGMNLGKELTPYFGDAGYSNQTSNTLHKLQALEYLYTHQEAYATLLQDLKQTDFDFFLPTELPTEVEVAHKIGLFGTTIHDIGIVYGKEPYLISLSMDNLDNQDARMSKLSKDLYELMEKTTH